MLQPPGGSWRAVACILGGFVMHLTLGTVYTFGNVTSYVTSYLHERVSSDIDYATTMWIPALMNMGQGAALTLGGRIYQRFGPTAACSLGCILLTLSTALSQLAVRSGVGALCVTYGLMTGLGVGLAYVSPMASAMKWFPQRRGLVNGIIVGGFGLGAVLFNWVQTAYLNPDNAAVAQDNYFHQASVLDRVPTMFLVLAAVYSFMQLAGVALIADPPPADPGASGASESLLDHVDGSHSPVSLDLSHPSTEAEVSVTLREALHTRPFWHLFFTFLFNTITIGFINPLWKAYGQQNIADDHFLAFVGSAAAVFNCCGRVVWGALCDRTSYRISMIGASALLAFAFATMQLTPSGGRWMFAVWVWLIFTAFSANFCLVVTAVANTYGVDHSAAIYGVIFSSTIISSPLSVGITNVFLTRLGFPVMFLIQATLVCISIIITITFRERRLGQL